MALASDLIDRALRLIGVVEQTDPATSSVAAGTLIARTLELLGVVEDDTPATLATTASAIIASALKEIGVLEATETAQAEDAADALVALNRMQAAWPGAVTFATLAESHTLSQVWHRALVLNLALEIAANYGAAPPATLVPLAQQAVADMKRRQVRGDLLTRLNASLQNWPGTVEFTDLTTTETLPALWLRAVPATFAIEIAPLYGVEPSAALVQAATEARTDMQRRALRDGALDVLADLLDTWDAEAHGLHQTVDTLTTDLVLPSGYTQAVVYNLAIALAPAYGTAPSPDVLKEAQRTLAIVRRSAVETPERVCDVGIGGFSRTRYNIYSGT